MTTTNPQPTTHNPQPTTCNLQPATSKNSAGSATTEVVISVCSVSKMYPLYARPSDRLKQSLWYALPSFLRGRPRQFYQEFWALHDVSFAVRKGETLGVIGRNGSGKSTLLQIIAGTLTPTQGEVQVKGRVAALLELGSGFNLEFTGRENVYLNGSIWGLTQEEIDAIFDDIAAFAEIGQFMDQPVRHYSSGMFVRLAFAVQTFVPKEILIVDEALAVGDEAFQRKCMAALDRFRDGGGTVLLVSHDTQAIVRQCERCLLLSQGELVVDGPSKPVTDLYQRLMYSTPQVAAGILLDLRQHGLKYALNQSQVEPKPLVQDHAGRPGIIGQREQFEPQQAQQVAGQGTSDWFDAHVPKTAEVVYGNGDAKIIDYDIYNQQGQQVNVLVVGRPYRWVYLVQFYRQAYNVQFGMMLKTVDGLDVAGIASRREQHYFDYIPASTLVEVSFSIKLNIVPGTYFLNAGVDGSVDGIQTYLHRRVDVAMIRVLPCDSRESYGIAYLEPHFSYKYLSENLGR